MADDTETRWRFTCENIAQATPREWGALDQRYYDAGLALIAAVRAENAHHPMCAVFDFAGRSEPCTCGLDARLRAR